MECHSNRHQEDASVYLRRFTWAALMGLSVLSGRAAWAGEPAGLGLPATPIPTVQPASAQKLADVIASHLEQAGTLRNYRVDIAVRAGVVELTGVVADQTQRDEVLRLVQGVPGVSHVSDRMTVTTGVIPVSRVQDKEKEVPEKLPRPSTNDPQPLPPPANAFPGPGPDGKPPGGMMPAPQPIFSCNPPGYAALNPPQFPPHAWPTYAPYNNFSRVAYPQAYPYKSWPYIGPLY